MWPSEMAQKQQAAALGQISGGSYPDVCQAEPVPERESIMSRAISAKRRQNCHLSELSGRLAQLLDRLRGPQPEKADPQKGVNPTGGKIMELDFELSRNDALLNELEMRVNEIINMA